MKFYGIFGVFILMCGAFGRVSSRYHHSNNLRIVSDSTTLVQDGTSYKNSVYADYFYDCNWVPNGYAVWKTANGNEIETFTFIKGFNIPGSPISGTVKVWVDDSLNFFVNGQLLLQNWAPFGISEGVYTTIDISSWIVNGDNVFKFEVTNNMGAAGFLYVADINYQV